MLNACMHADVRARIIFRYSSDILNFLVTLWNCRVHAFILKTEFRLRYYERRLFEIAVVVVFISFS